MMKKLLLSIAVFIMGTVMASAQFAEIGIIGGATSVGWDGPDIDMTTTDGEIYTLQGVTLTAGGLKFRQDNAWNDNNWGGTSWPSGAGIQNQSGVDIPCQPGLYDITFNLISKQYNFVDVGGFDEVHLNGAGGVTFALSTTNGVDYFYNNAVIANEVNMIFTSGTNVWGATDFPSGTATLNGGDIPVPANSYNITFNLETGAYMFNFVTISLTGTGVQDWGIDADFTTTNGYDYTLEGHTFLDGEIKFRLNHDWTVTWGGGTLPSGTMSMGGGNVAITAGTYDVSFNRSSGDFAFTESTNGTEVFTSGTVHVYPNPAQNEWTFTAANHTITNIQLVDVSGKIVYTGAANAQEVNVNAAQLAAGLYFAQITAGNGTSVIRVLKK